MYAVAPLIERAVLLNPPSAQELARITSDTLKRLRGHAYSPPVVGVAAVRLPSDQAVLERLLTSAMPPDWPHEEALAAGSTALVQPLYIAPLADDQALTADRRIRQVALVSAISADGDIWISIGRLRVEQSVGRKPWSYDAQITVEWYDDLNAACDALEALYLEAPTHAGLPKLPRAWWVGGGKGSAATVPIDWKKRIAGAGRVAGYDIEVIEAAGARPELPGRIANERPAGLIDWSAYTLGKPQSIVSRYQRDVSSGLYIPIAGATTFDDALSCVRSELRRAVLTSIETGVASPDDPKTVLDAVEKAKRECLNLHFLDKALASAKESHFPRPAQVLEYLRALDAVVKAWRAGEVESGDFGSALADLGVPRYMSGVSDTALNQYEKDYERVYKGNKVSLGPHVANGVGAVTRILRIYWYVDTELQIFVIGHVGKKLRDASNR